MTAQAIAAEAEAAAMEFFAAGLGPGPAAAAAAQDYRARHRARIIAASESRKYKRKLIQRSIQKLRNGGGAGGGGVRMRRNAERDDKREEIMAYHGEARERGGGESGGRSRERHLASATASDVEKEAGKLASLPPAKVSLPKDAKIVQISSGLHHTLLLTKHGDVFAFGSNSHGQLGQKDLCPRGTPSRVALPCRAAAVAAGGNHSVVLSEAGEIYTFGSHSRGQLGREAEAQLAESVASAEDMAARELWFACPVAVAGIGPRYGRTASWIGACADQTLVKLDESLINVHSLSGASVAANARSLIILPTTDDGPPQQSSAFSSLVINRQDGFCRSFNGSDQESFAGRPACLDPVYGVLWSFDRETSTFRSHLPALIDMIERGEGLEDLSMSPSAANILSPQLALPVTTGARISRSQASLNLLACLDTLTQMPEATLTSLLEEESTANGKVGASGGKIYTKEDFSAVSRFDSHGGGWGYSGHSIEAIRFSCDTDVLIGGYGLFGGRGEYVGKIKLFDIGPDGGDQENDGDLLAETEDITFECGARQKFPILFDEPVAIQAGRWYIAWARVSGPSSDCGSSGQTQVTTEDQVVFSFRSSKKSNNGTDVNAGQVPQILYRMLAAETQPSHRRFLDAPETVCVLSPNFPRAVSADCFEALIQLVRWSWSAFRHSVRGAVGAGAVLPEDAVSGGQTTTLNMDRLLFVCRAGLRLLVTYILEAYPAKPHLSSSGQPKLPVAETQTLAQSVADAKTLLQGILRDPLPFELVHLTEGVATAGSTDLFQNKRATAALLVDAHRAFVACFHAFYPTGYLKWACLCNLLATMSDSSCLGHVEERSDRLLAAVLDSLCSPMVRLRHTFPITYTPESETSRAKTLSPSENLSVAASMIQAGEGGQQGQRFPVLTELMGFQSHHEGARFSSWTFREVLDRLLAIVSLPVKQAMKGEVVTYSRELEEKSCQVISAVVAELTSKTATTEADIQSLGGRILHSTPNR
jgi:E3 ubiquitin-protein ligase MYCBP2